MGAVSPRDALPRPEALSRGDRIALEAPAHNNKRLDGTIHVYVYPPHHACEWCPRQR